MPTKKITLSKLNNIVNEIINEEINNKIGINLRSLLDGELSLAVNKINLSDYNERSKFINKIESRLIENDWISMSNGVTFEKTFTPTKKHS